MEHLLPREAEHAEHSAELGFAQFNVGRNSPTNVVEQRLVHHEIVVFLGVIASVHLVAPLKIAEVRFGLAGQDPQQARLAGAIEAKVVAGVQRAVG